MGRFPITDTPSRFSCRSGCFSFDVDDSAEAKARAMACWSSGTSLVSLLDALVAGVVADGDEK